MGATVSAKPLAGHAVFLSASVPSPDRAEKYRLIPDAFARIEEAVLRVAGAVFHAGGTLVFGGHPSISPLIGYLCAQYQPQLAAEGEPPQGRRDEREPAGPRVVMWQSEAYLDSWAEPSERLATMPGVSVNWTPAVNGERYDPELRGVPQCEESLKLMRRKMIDGTQPVAMVAIGGMEGVEMELAIFQELRHGRPVYVLTSTGGAAAVLAADKPNQVRSFDDEVRANVAEFRRRVREQQMEDRQDAGIAVPFPEEEEIAIPYAAVAARIVEDIQRSLKERR
ncbi:MAG: hypothetical protein EBR86_16940 [Planctomycetia bacterium]|nr:hypothetical protein [Planctomycetia bacterium]